MEAGHMTHLRRRRGTVAAIAAIGLVSALAPAGVAVGKISPPSCSNNGGQSPPGQQPVCNGGGLTQNPATNPAGHAPPGQQP
jgi:hypothetical protein